MAKTKSKLLAALYLAQQPYAKGVESDVFKTLKTYFGGNTGSPVNAENAASLIWVIVQILLAVAGSIAVIFFMLGAYKYIIARGNEEASEAAKKTMTSSLWGIILIIMAFALIQIIVAVLLRGGAGLGGGLN